MQIKKFNNLWLMGIIIFGVILVGLYIAKIIYPSAVIHIAELEPIVQFGNYVDTHLWAYYLFTGFVSFVGGCVYCCACCRKKHLSWLEHLIVLIEVAVLFVIQKYLSEHYLTLNITFMVLMPTIICAINKNKDIKYFYSTAATLSIHLIAQIISVRIRDISTLIHYPNSATLYILLIDAFIWLVLLYNYFNYKEKRDNGNT